MSIIVIGLWMGLLFVLVKVGVLKKWTLWMKASPAVLYLGYFMMIAVPMNFQSPQGPAVVFRDSVQVSPAVGGPVIEVAARSQVPLDAGDVLFTIDPGPYQAAVDALDAQLELARMRLEQSQQLAEQKAGSVYDVQQFDAEVRQIEAQLAGAHWNLEHTRVFAPMAGFVTHLALQPGTVVSPQVPVMSFIATSPVIGVLLDQAHLRNVDEGQRAEVVLRMYPGKVYPATVRKIIRANEQGQITPDGLALDTDGIQDDGFWVSLTLDDGVALEDLPAGSVGTVAIYASAEGSTAKLGGLIRAIMLRIETWMNYL